MKALRYCMSHKKGFDILFTGDVEGMGEEKVLEELRGKWNFTWEVLKVAHHGSANSTRRRVFAVCKA